MTEAEEVAEAMLPQYHEWKKSLHWSKQGHSVVGVKDWVMQQMREYESYNVIDAVQAALVELVFPPKKEK